MLGSATRSYMRLTIHTSYKLCIMHFFLFLSLKAVTCPNYFIPHSPRDRTFKFKWPDTLTRLEARWITGILIGEVQSEGRHNVSEWTERAVIYLPKSITKFLILVARYTITWRRWSVCFAELWGFRSPLFWSSSCSRLPMWHNVWRHCCSMKKYGKINQVIARNMPGIFGM